MRQAYICKATGVVTQWVDRTLFSYPSEIPEHLQVVDIEGPVPAGFNPLHHGLKRCWYRDGKFTAETPPDVAAAELAQARTETWSRAQEKRDALINGGVPMDGRKWHSDETARARYVAQTYGSGEKSTWRTMDGTADMTPAVAKKVLEAIAVHDAAVHAAAATHKAAIFASSEPAAYDFSDGWPDV